MINLFNLNKHVIDTSNYQNLLHDKIVINFENVIKKYVGAKHAVSFNSATNAIFLSLLNKNVTVKVPSMIPPVVLNAIITSNNQYKFIDDTEWIGNSYILHKFKNYKIVDSAQKLEKYQFKKECDPNDLLIFSFYPTKPVGGCDGAMIVSDDEEKINYLREMAFNGMSYANNNWERVVKYPGYKMYMNSIQADIALRNFKLYNNKLKKLKKIRNLYNKKLGYTNSSNHLYRIEIDDRSGFIKYMKDNGVLCGIHYEAAHLNPVYALSKSKCPISEIKSTKTVSIPYHENLTEQEIYRIIELICQWNHIN